MGVPHTHSRSLTSLALPLPPGAVCLAMPAAAPPPCEAVARTSTSTPTSVEALRRAADPDYEPPMFDLRSRHWRGAWWPWWRPCVAPAADAYDREP